MKIEVDNQDEGTVRDLNTESQSDIEIGIEERNPDLNIERQDSCENPEEYRDILFQDGFLADMYREKEQGKEGGTPGWDQKIGYYKNR